MNSSKEVSTARSGFEMALKVALNRDFDLIKHLREK